MSEKVHKALRRQQNAQMASEMSCQIEDERKAKYLTVRLMPLIPFIAMVFASPQGNLYLPEGFRDPLYISIGGCLFYLILWAIDIFMLKKKDGMSASGNGWGSLRLSDVCISGSVQDTRTRNTLLPSSISS